MVKLFLKNVKKGCQSAIPRNVGYNKARVVFPSIDIIIKFQEKLLI